FTHINTDPSQESPSLGYLRRGSRVRIVRRQTVKTQDGYISWVLTDGQQQGWLKEDVMDIYNNENQAITASELLSR
ncbi:SH3 domain-containing protein, partial [Treponema sp. R6D11]